MLAWLLLIVPKPRSRAQLCACICAACRYNYFFRQGTVRAQTVMITGGIIYGTYLMFTESQR